MNIDNLKIWLLTDGSQGMISQTKGLGNELSANIEEFKTEIIFPWNRLQPGILPVFSWIFKNKLPINEIPDVVISCGRKSVYLSIYLKKKYPNIINIHIQNPKISSKYFSFVIAPNHDALFGENIINSTGAIHHFKKSNNLKNYYKINTKNLITCIIGGRNNHYNFSKENTFDLCERIKKI
ncbi:mitochondrial fission ELM1 family protein, partial [Pelagibacteraceae bacterium]|nr:mitochondrial fission ELM1 family protein [Pelagibacteraceae bacterium]